MVRRYRRRNFGLWRCCRRGATAETFRLLKWREMQACRCAPVPTECCWEMFTTAQTHPINNIATEHTATRCLFCMCVCVCGVCAYVPLPVYISGYTSSVKRDAAARLKIQNEADRRFLFAGVRLLSVGQLTSRRAHTFI